MDLRRYANRWFALQVRARSELMCALILHSKGYEEFLPLYRSNGNSRFPNGCMLPLYPGYLFCRLNADAGGPILSTPGVIRIVGAGVDPSPISEEEIANVRLIVNSGCQAQIWPFLQVGQRVRLTLGPLAGLEGIVLRSKNSDRLVVSINVLHRSTAVEVDSRWVASASPIVGGSVVSV
jgi:hypothetical protein